MHFIVITLKGVSFLARGIENSGKGYRGRLEIIRDVLLVTLDAGKVGSKKTHIMYGANLSYKLLMRYLGVALQSGLVCDEDSCFVITEKGKEFLEFYKDYEKSQTEIEKRSAYLKNGRKTLEKLTVP
jgi:predicted transcriptional regulator